MYATYKGRLLVEATLETKSPLHIGGGHDEVEPLHNDQGDETQVAAIMRDWRGQPVIPGTTLKGVMRRLVAQGERLEGGSDDSVSSLCKDVFGDIRDDDRGSAGVLVPYCATLNTPAPVESRVDQRTDSAAGTFVSARTAIDPATGTAFDHKLFHQTVVGAGAKFKLRLAVHTPVENFDQGVAQVLARLLATLQSLDGIAVGRSRGDGWGRLQLVSIDRCMLWRIDQTTSGVETKDRLGELQRAVKEAKLYHDHRALYALSLSTAEPFFVQAAKDRAAPATAEGEKNTIQAMRTNGMLPELPGSSLMGALCSRAKWYRDLQKTRGRPFPVAEIDGEPADPVDRLFGESAETLMAGRERDDKRTGWAGLLRLVSVVPNPAPLKKIASVRIDRFSHAPMDGALFNVEAFVAPRFLATLAVDARARKSDVDFARDFLFSLRSGPAGGLTLGAGGNRGFGWFDVEVEERSAP